MKHLRLITLIIVCLLLTGCIGPAPSKKGTGGTGTIGESYVKLAVNWDTLNADSPVRPMSASLLASPADEVALIGARVMAPNINALLAQSATRQTAENQGIITIPVPATTNANLYAVAVDKDGTPLMLGYLKGLTIAQNSVLTITTDELTWITPDAYFTGKIKWETPYTTYVQTVDPSILYSNNLTAPDEIAGQGCGEEVECSATVYVNITDPFGSSPLHKMICLSGMSVGTPCHASLDHNGEWVEAYLYCRSDPLKPCSGRAYVDPSAFLIPDSIGMFGPQFGPMTIDWRP